MGSPMSMLPMCSEASSCLAVAPMVAMSALARLGIPRPPRHVLLRVNVLGMLIVGYLQRVSQQFGHVDRCAIAALPDLLSTREPIRDHGCAMRGVLDGGQ